LGRKLAIWGTRCVLKCITVPSIGLFDEFYLFIYFCYILFVVSKVAISYASDELVVVLEVGDNFIVNA
jgi:hypothetical protein